MTAVALVSVSKRYGSVAAVDCVSLEAAAGERLVLVGPSGCGKTTTLRLIAGLEQPDGGSIQFDGRPAARLAPRDRDVAMVFQRGALYPQWNVAENLAFPLRQRKVPAAERRRRVAWAAELLGIGPLLSRMPRELSGGQQQRVALGRALVRRPRVFLLDEPLASLDPAMRHQLLQEILRLHGQTGTTMIYVTHDRAEALSVGQRLVVLQAGRIEQVGTPEEVYGRPASRGVADLLGRRPMNVLPAILAAVDGRPTWILQGLGASVSAEHGQPLEFRQGARLDLAFRPEHAGVSATAPAAGEIAIPGTVEMVEQLGDEAFVTLRAGTRTLVGRWPGFCPLGVGHCGVLAVALWQWHAFDPATGRRVW